MRCAVMVGLIATAILWRSAIADSLVLTDGTRLAGRVDRVDPDAVELIFCGSRRTYLRAAVQSIEFNATAGECSKESAEPVGMAAGTRLLVKLSRPIDPAIDPIGQVIGGTLEQPVSRGDRLLIRKSAPVLLQLEQSPDAAGTASPVLHVTSVRLDSGWAALDATADEGLVPAAAPTGNLSHVFTVVKRGAP